MNKYPIRWITDTLAVGYAPRSEDDLRDMRTSGINAIVNLCAECYDLNESESNYGFNVNYLPVADEAAPTLKELKALIDWIHQTINSGNRVLVHCRYGIGRTGTVVLSYLLQAGYTFGDAKKMMKHTPSWPTNRLQEELVDRFALELDGTTGVDSLSTARPKIINKFFDRWMQLSKWG